jgi:hypothetical protein
VSRVFRGLRALAGPLLILVAVLAQFAAVVRGRVYAFEDITDYFQPLWSAAARAVSAGRLPLWERGAWSGQPLVTDPQLGVFYPGNWLWLLLPVLRAYAWTVLLHAAWAGLGMFALARVRGGSRSAAALAGVTLAVGTYIVLQTRHVMFVEVTAWTPWVIAAGWRYLDGGRRADLAGFAAALGLLLLTGGVSMAIYSAWLAAALLACRAAHITGSGRRSRLLGLLGGCVLAVSLAAPALVPALAHAPLSPRALGVDPQLAADFAWPDYRYLGTLAWTGAFRDAQGAWVGGANRWELGGYSAGTLTLGLALLSLGTGAGGRRAEHATVVVLLLLACLAARRDSLVQHLLALSPVYRATRCPARALYVFSLALPLLAAEGTDWLGARLPRGRLVPSALALCAAFELVYAGRHDNPSVTLAEAEAASRIDVLPFLEAHRGERYVNQYSLHRLHNSGLLWNLDGASGYHSLPIWRYLHYLWIANHGAPYVARPLRHDLSGQGLWRLRSPLVDALAVRWFVGVAPPDGDFRLRLRGSDGIAVWENQRALPYGWIVHQAHVVTSADAAASAIAASDFDPRREVVLEEAPSPAPTGSGDEAVSGLAAPSTDAVAVEVELRSPGVLVLPDPYYPWWRATVDGKPAPLLAADYALRGVALAAGRHVVSMRLVAWPVDVGLAIGACAAVGLAALAWLRRRVNR